MLYIFIHMWRLQQETACANRWMQMGSPHTHRKLVRQEKCRWAFAVWWWLKAGIRVEIERMPDSDICSLFSPCHSHPVVHIPTIALDAHNMTKQTSYCHIKLWQRRPTERLCVYPPAPTYKHVSFVVFAILNPEKWHQNEICLLSCRVSILTFHEINTWNVR